MPRYRLICLLLLLFPVSGFSVPEGGTSAQGESVFAPPEMAGQPVALAVDDAGKVYLSVSGRNMGRGVPPAGDAGILRRDDLAVMSLEDRKAVLGRWMKDGLVQPAVPGAGESLVCLVDADGDGRADQKSVIAGDFNDLLDGPAGGVYPLPGGSVLFGCTPALWRLEDDNHDLRADRRLPLFQGLGIRNGSGTPGCGSITEGPDGRIYFTGSDRGFRLTSQEGERFLGEGTGAVFRCWPGGADLELMARGLCNPAGIVVDGRGRVFVADTAPDGMSGRLLYVLPGSDFGWNAAMPQRGFHEAGPCPAGELPPAGWLMVRVTGMSVYPQLVQGAGPPSLVIANGRPGGGLTRCSLKEQGGGFTAVPGPDIWSGGAVSGVAVAPDGALLWPDWGAEIAPAATPRICRMPPATAAELWQSGAAVLKEGLSGRPAAVLAARLEDPHPLVRKRAREALVELGFQEALDPLSRTARRSPSLQARLNAVWGMARLAQKNPLLLNEIILLFSSTEPEIRALALHIAGENGYDGPAQDLLQLLRDPAPGVRVEAALAVGRLRLPDAADSLCAAIVACGDSDPWIRHSLTWALSRVLPATEIAARGLRAEAVPLKMAALQALRMQQAAEAADFIADGCTPVATAAAEAVYDDMIFCGYPSLAALLERCAAEGPIMPETVVQRALAAALHLGTAAAADAVGAFASLPDEKLPALSRAAALKTLEAWDTPPDREPVYGRYDEPLPRPAGLARPWLVKLQPGASPAAVPAELQASALDNAKPAALRMDALQQLALVQPAKAMESARSLLEGNAGAALRATARGLIMKLDPPSAYTQITEAFAGGSLPEIQTVLQISSRFDSKQSEALWLDLGKRYLAGSLDPAVRLEVQEGLILRDNSTRSKFRRILEAADAALNEDLDPMARWRVCETGGDPDKGRALYETGRLICCTGCHSLRGRGGLSGPELDGVAGRLDRSKLLTALIHPSGEIAPGYGLVSVTLQEGGEVSGLVRKRDDLNLLLSTAGGVLRLNSEAVKSIGAPVSPMPSAAALLTPREIRDLVAWLATLQ